MSVKMCPVVHFEMPAQDRDRIAKFYQSAFGWQTEMLGPEMGEYVLATTTEVDVQCRPKTPGHINGGFFPQSSDPENKSPSVVIAVEDIRASMKDVVGAGGQILGEVHEIPGIGQFVAFKDTEGNRCGMLQPSMTE